MPAASHEPSRFPEAVAQLVSGARIACGTCMLCASPPMLRKQRGIRARAARNLKADMPPCIVHQEQDIFGTHEPLTRATNVPKQLFQREE